MTEDGTIYFKKRRIVFRCGKASLPLDSEAGQKFSSQDLKITVRQPKHMDIDRTRPSLHVHGLLKKRKNELDSASLSCIMYRQCVM